MASGSRPRRLDLPLSPDWESEDDYVQELLTFATSSILFRHLCGGVHILDFLTREPDIYSNLLDVEWRDWFDRLDTWDILQFILHSEQPPHEPPPASLRDYIAQVRRLCLNRDSSCVAVSPPPAMPRHIAVGMKPKKMHEVSNFASFVNDLSDSVSERHGGQAITLVDFGSGQNYLGRTLACPPYNKNVIAIEKKHHNIKGAQGMDVYAKLAKKEKIMRNKKEYKRRLAMFPDEVVEDSAVHVAAHVLERLGLDGEEADAAGTGADDTDKAQEPGGSTSNSSTERGSMTYIEHEISDGELEEILHCRRQQASPSDPPPELMTISLHSCGNLSHHAIRSLVLNRSVAALAVVGCCYNLLTERLGPQSYKIPYLRPNHPRLVSTSTTYDPHGFPMSRVLEDFPLPDSCGGGKGVRLNITARMMAVQAPYNWGREDSEMFFRRHFYRALLQRILLDRGAIDKGAAAAVAAGEFSTEDGIEAGGAGTAPIVGSLRKSCFVSFRAYVRGALDKLCRDPVHGALIGRVTGDLSDRVIDEYEAKYAYARKNLSVTWTLMAFSAGVVESIIAVDRWLYLKQQDCVSEAWVQPLFDYEQSPRNLCVVAVKKKADESS